MPLAEADSFKTDLKVGQVPRSLSCHPDGPSFVHYLISTYYVMDSQIVLVLSTVVIIIIYQLDTNAGTGWLVQYYM